MKYIFATSLCLCFKYYSKTRVGYYRLKDGATRNKSWDVVGV